MDSPAADSFAMVGGEGPTSYSQNSTFQGSISDVARTLMVKAIQQNIVIPTGDDTSTTAPRRAFRIADLGCSVGPNTISCVEAIIGAVEAKYKAGGLPPGSAPDFQVFFNDQEGSDFNTLFRILPQDRSYTVAGVPGSFHRKLFPAASMDVMHSSIALHWLSKVPEEVRQAESRAWNKGRITYCQSAPEVVEAFGAQFQRDLRDFFRHRSVEMVDDGILVILLPCRPDGTRPSEALMVQGNESLIGHLLVDMAKEGLVDEALVDSFNLPFFIPTAAEVAYAASAIGCFSIEVAEKVLLPRHVSENLNRQPQRFSCMMQAILEDIFVQHFGPATVDLLFTRLPKKVEEKTLELPLPEYLGRPDKFENLFMLLRKR